MPYQQWRQRHQCWPCLFLLIPHRHLHQKCLRQPHLPILHLYKRLCQTVKKMTWSLCLENRQIAMMLVPSSSSSSSPNRTLIASPIPTYRSSGIEKMGTSPLFGDESVYWDWGSAAGAAFSVWVVEGHRRQRCQRPAERKQEPRHCVLMVFQLFHYQLRSKSI